MRIIITVTAYLLVGAFATLLIFGSDVKRPTFVEAVLSVLYWPLHMVLFLVVFLWPRRK
jgi:hypothetical protein